VKLAAVVVVALACTSPTPQAVPQPTALRAPATDVTAQNWSGPALDRGQLVLHDAFGGAHPVEVEIADTAPSRTRGMMWRTSVPAGTGMLFIFPEEQVQRFWMRNTLVPLDMLFVDKSGQVVGIVAEAEPQTLDGRSIGRPSLYVVEVAGGWAEKTGIAPGARVELKGSLAGRIGQP
jgi:uncharacterized protein